jgi:hypothetical protein
LLFGLEKNPQPDRLAGQIGGQRVESFKSQLRQALRRLWRAPISIGTKTHYGCPVSFNRLTPAWFLNESKEPNARCCDENYDFYATRDIPAGQEITVDYETFSEYREETKE